MVSGPREPFWITRLNYFALMDMDAPGNWYVSDRQGAKVHNNPEYDRLFKASRTELDESKRQELLQNAGQVLYDDPPTIFLYQQALIQTHSPKVQPFTINYDGTLPTDKLVKEG